MRMIPALIAAFVVAALSGCTEETAPSKNTQNTGKKSDPINLPESFRKDGLKVRVTARPQRDVMSFRMYGEIIEVIRIEAQ